MALGIPAFPRAARVPGQRWRRGNRRSQEARRSLPVGRLVPLRGTEGTSPWDRWAETPRKRPRASQAKAMQARAETQKIVTAEANVEWNKPLARLVLVMDYRRIRLAVDGSALL